MTATELPPGSECLMKAPVVPLNWETLPSRSTRSKRWLAAAKSRVCRRAKRGGAVRGLAAAVAALCLLHAADTGGAGAGTAAAGRGRRQDPSAEARIAGIGRHARRRVGDLELDPAALKRYGWPAAR